MQELSVTDLKNALALGHVWVKGKLKRVHLKCPVGLVLTTRRGGLFWYFILWELGLTV